MRNTRRLVDATLVNDEVDLLLLRMEHLAPYVDHFYVAESPETYTGLRKPLYVTEQMERFTDFRDRMTVLVYTGPSDCVGWNREEIARGALGAAVADLPDSANVLFSDLDEIPSLEQLVEAAIITEPHAVPMDMFYRRANWRLEGETPWVTPKVSPVAQLPNDFTRFRWPETPYPLLDGQRGGHFSYMGFGADRVAEKVAAFSHSEFLFAMDEAEHLLAVADSLALDHFGRSRLRGHGLLTVLPESEWTDLHRWIQQRRPEWFDTSSPGWGLWRRINAAVIDDAMQSQDLDMLRVAGSLGVWREAGARKVIRSKLSGARGRLRGLYAG